MSGKELYERMRRHEPDREPWNYIDQAVRDFWERLAKALTKEGRLV